MNFTSPLRPAQSAAAAGILLVCATAAQAADSYSAGHLTIPTLSNGPVTYSNVVVAVGAITSGPAGSAPLRSVDSYDISSGQIMVNSVSVGAGTFYNAAITVASLTSIGTVTGADSYNGTNLTVSYVQVGNSFYRNAVVTVSSIVHIGGGMPTGAWDIYNGANGELTIPAVQVGATVYTNVTVRVKGIVSVGTVQGTPQTIVYTAPNLPEVAIGASTAITATTNSNLPITFVSTTPQTCAIVANTAPVQNFFISYSGTGFSGGMVLSGVPVDTNIFEIESVIGSLGGHPIGMLPTSNPGSFNGIPYPVFTSPGGLAYDNIFYANGGPLMDQAGLGLQFAATEFNLYYAAGFGYLFTNDALANQHPPYLPMTFSAQEVTVVGNALVGLAQGNCNVVAFQNGNYYPGYGYASAIPVQLNQSIGEIILP